MNKTTLVILATAVLAALVSGCATTQEPQPEPRAQAREADKPVLRPFSGVGSYGGYIYRRYE